MPEKKVSKKVAKKASKKVVKKAAVKKVATKKTLKKAASKKVAAKKVVKKAVKKVAKKSAAKKATSRQVKFSYYSPLSGSVEIAGSFNDWVPSELPMSKSKDGLWSAKLKLAPGQYEYKFVFDGSSWECDPDSPTVESEHGHNNVLEVK